MRPFENSVESTPDGYLYVALATRQSLRRAETAVVEKAAWQVDTGDRISTQWRQS